MKLNEIDLLNKKHYRIIPSAYPPVNYLEDLVDSDEMEALWEIESLTNERMREEVGELMRVAAEDRVNGPGASVVMAAFTHIGKPSRFSNGSFGIYYASLEQETAITETTFHREKFLSATNEDPCEITMRMYEAKIKKPLFDIRGGHYPHFHHPEEYAHSQKFGEELKRQNAWGLIYDSVRQQAGQCLAILRPPATSIPIQTKHLRYVWDGKIISTVFEISALARPAF